MKMTLFVITVEPLLRKKRVDDGVQPLNDSPLRRNLGKIAAIQSKIDSMKKYEKSCSTWYNILLFTCMIGYVASIYFGFNGNLVLIIGGIGIALGILGGILARREIKKLEDELSRL